MKSHFLKALLAGSICLSSHAFAETLWIQAANNNLNLDSVNGTDYETIIVKDDSTIGKFVNDAPVVNFINVQANLTVNSDVIVNQVSLTQYKGNDSLTIKGDLTVNGALSVHPTNSVNVSGTTTLNGGTTVSQLTGSAKLTTDKLVINGHTKLIAGSGSSGSVVANEVEVNHTLTLISGSSIATSDETAGIMTVGEGGHVWQQGGTVELATLVDGGAMTMYSGSFDSLELLDGELNIRGDISTGDLILDGGEVNFLGAYTLDLGGNDLILGDNVIITLSVATLEDITGSYTLFKNLGSNSTDTKNLMIELTDGTASKSVQASYINGTFSVAAVPEPTTATLSLLALAGLAARRRRK
ncbi:MAG: PEP-CTERM sorting domain-containing protein [Akkermansia sp.]|nr:PEP-CTERM sorting domain-containing protein [Akkermansia sp.]